MLTQNTLYELYERWNFMFFITCFEKIETDKLGWLNMGDQRVFGYKETFEQAERH